MERVSAEGLAGLRTSFLGHDALLGESDTAETAQAFELQATKQGSSVFR